MQINHKLFILTFMSSKNALNTIEDNSDDENEHKRLMEEQKEYDQDSKYLPEISDEEYAHMIEISEKQGRVDANMEDQDIESEEEVKEYNTNGAKRNKMSFNNKSINNKDEDHRNDFLTTRASNDEGYDKLPQNDNNLSSNFYKNEKY